MAQMNNTIFSGIIIAFIAMVIGISLFISIADQTAKTTTSNSRSINDSITGLLNKQVSLSNDDIDTTRPITVINTTGIVTSTNYTINGTPGGFILRAGQVNNTVYNVTYFYYDNTYINDSTTRTLSTTTLIILAIGLLATIIAVFLPKIQEMT